MVDLGEAEARMQLLVAEISEHMDNIISEEDAKFQIINRVLLECLGWNHSDVGAERKHDNGYSDYVISNNGTPGFILEAKRVGQFSINVADTSKVRELVISGSSMRDAVSGIEQAVGYAGPNGIPIAVLTDGLRWVIVKPHTPGSHYKSKRAIVFPSTDALIKDFSIFFDMLSKSQFNKRIYSQKFDQIHSERQSLSKQYFAPIPYQSVPIVHKSELAHDLDGVFSNFFARLVGDDDELLFSCFVETRESRIAEFSLEKMTAQILGNIAPKDKEIEAELASLIETNVNTADNTVEQGQTVFIIGPTGSGKTTFISRFFKHTLTQTVRGRCLNLKVNCLDSSGNEEKVLPWLTEELIKKIEEKSYGGAPNWNQLLGLYHLEYKQRSQGVDAPLYNRDKAAFREKFSSYLEKEVAEDREGYLKRMLSFAIKSQKMLPIIIVDNTDEFTLEFKERCFQFAQSLRRALNHCLVIFPITDKSAWSLSKTDLYGIYKSKSFFLPTPSPREVFRKRIDFIKEKLLFENQKTARQSSNYFTERGIRVSIRDLEGFAQVLETIFVEQDYTSKTIGELANFNIRRTLELSQRAITSPVLQLDDLVKSFISGQTISIDFTKFLDALIKGDYAAFKNEPNSEIHPIFQSSRTTPHSPLLALRILALLSSVYRADATIDERHLQLKSIVSYFDALGCSEGALYSVLETMISVGLIEPFDSSESLLSDQQKLAITPKGYAHLRLSSKNSVMFYQMALTTPIADEDAALKISSIYKSSEPFSAKLKKIKDLFLTYLIDEDKKYLSIEAIQGQYESQRDLLADLNRFSAERPHSEEAIEVLGNDYRQGTIRTGVIAIVDFFDHSKGYGFVEVDEIDRRVFLHIEQLKDFGIEEIADRDELLCDVARGPKGLFIEKVHDIVRDKQAEEGVACRITRLFPDRGYGFVKINQSGEDAFFHYTIVPEEKREHLDEGQPLTATVAFDEKRQSWHLKNATLGT